MIRIYKDTDGTILMERDGEWRTVAGFSLDALFQQADPAAHAAAAFETGTLQQQAASAGAWAAPIGNQEVWAAGVTYYRSREARMEESEASGGDRFYNMVYDAVRPELFFKATAARTRGHLAPVRVRADSNWDVPEPELTLAINSAGKVFGYTIGNDMSSREIEGENPLYLPQAKVYRGSCAIGPALTIPDAPLPGTTVIHLEIYRIGEMIFTGETAIDQIKRGFDELAGFLFTENEFPDGAFLMTGTGVVPGDGFTLRSGDVIRISIDGLGILENPVE
ncbi:MAG: fumarylacetoacetate hydrolase family protein [Verrucomicrobia bacterium]|nr:fumarylacetoacetate hydrolase family protein [Verrucomicrobiota bacterium]